MSATRTVTLDEDTADELERLAAQRGITVPALLKELVHSHVPADAPMHVEEGWPDWMEPDAIGAVIAGLTTVEHLRTRREAWQRQAEAQLTAEQEEERAAWTHIREAAAAELLRRGE